MAPKKVDEWIMPAYWTKWTFRDDFLPPQDCNTSALKVSFMFGSNNMASTLPIGAFLRLWLWCPCRKRTCPQVQGLPHVPVHPGPWCRPVPTCRSYSVIFSEWVALLGRCGKDMSPESPPSMEKLAGAHQSWVACVYHAKQSICQLPAAGPSWSAGQRPGVRRTLTWDWPVTGVPLFSCSSPFSPSL